MKGEPANQFQEEVDVIVVNKHKKAQSTIVGFMTITLIILAAVSGTFFWAKETVEKNNDFTEVRRMENKLIEIGNAITDVANSHTQRTVVVDINKGYLFLENDNTITYSADLDLPLSKISPGTLIGNGSSDGPCYWDLPIEPAEKGTLGQDTPYCLIEQGAVDLNLRFINLLDSKGRTHRINLTARNTASAGEGLHNVLIKYKTTNTIGGFNYPVVEIEIK